MTTFDEWRADASDLTSGGLRLAVHDHGPEDAPVVTYLHGFPASSLDVVPVAERIGDERRILSLDFPGFGASEKPRGHPFSIDACADAVEDLWRAAGVTTSVLVSHDYGVSVGQELLSRRLDVDITGTVWSNGGLYPDLHRPTAGQKMLLDPDHGAEVAAAMDEELFRGGIAITWGQRRPMTDDEIHEMWESMAHDGGSAMANELLHYIADRRRNAERWRCGPHDLRGSDVLRVGRPRSRLGRPHDRTGRAGGSLGRRAPHGRRRPLAAARVTRRGRRRDPRSLTARQDLNPNIPLPAIVLLHGRTR